MAPVRTRRHLLMGLGVLLAALPARATPVTLGIGQILPDTRLRGLNGAARRLASFRGRPLIINVWASWCGPCRQEAASLERLAWGPLGSQLTVIGISTDDYIENAQAWLRQSNATINHYLDHDLEMETLLGASHLPLTVLVDADGRVVDKVTGAQDWDSPAATRRIARAFRLDTKGSPKP